MTKVTFYKPDKTADEKLKFAVIAARYQVNGYSVVINSELHGRFQVVIENPMK